MLRIKSLALQALNKALQNFVKARPGWPKNSQTWQCGPVVRVAHFVLQDILFFTRPLPCFNRGLAAFTFGLGVF